MTPHSLPFDLSDAQMYAGDAAMAYDHVTWLGSRYDTQVYRSIRVGHVTYAFRGSERKLADWRNNFRVYRLPFDRSNPQCGRVHRGYRAALDEVWEQLADDIEVAACRGREIAFTGHSAGGALAILAAARLGVDYHPTVYTFGAPPVGDRVFARWYPHQAATWRVEHDADIVPWLLTGSYRHVGRCAFLPGAGRVLLEPSMLARIAAAMTCRSPVHAVTHHAMDQYRTAIAEVLQ